MQRFGSLLHNNDFLLFCVVIVSTTKFIWVRYRGHCVCKFLFFNVGALRLNVQHNRNLNHTCSDTYFISPCKNVKLNLLYILNRLLVISFCYKSIGIPRLKDSMFFEYVDHKVESFLLLLCISKILLNIITMIPVDWLIDTNWIFDTPNLIVNFQLHSLQFYRWRSFLWKVEENFVM